MKPRANSVTELPTAWHSIFWDYSGPLGTGGGFEYNNEMATDAKRKRW